MLANASSLGYGSNTMADLSEEELRAWQALLHAHHQVTRRLDVELAHEHGLSLPAYEVLLRLAKAPKSGISMTKLANRVLLTPSRLTRLLDRLVAEGLVVRWRSPTDARVMLARLTPSGRERLRRAAKTHLRGIHNHFTSRLSTNQLRDVADALEAIVGPHQPH
jgi:DNA-binding MarR family transcriptional regulator